MTLLPTIRRRPITCPHCQETMRGLDRRTCMTPPFPVELDRVACRLPFGLAKNFVHAGLRPREEPHS